QLGVDALQQAGEARVPGEALHEVPVVDDFFPNILELGRWEVKKLAALEGARVDAVGDALERHGQGPELLRQPGGVGPRALEGARLYHHDDVLQLAELPLVLRVADHVRGALRQQRMRRSFEGERADRVRDAEDPEDERNGDRQAWAPARYPDHPAERSTRPVHAQLFISAQPSASFLSFRPERLKHSANRASAGTVEGL